MKKIFVLIFLFLYTLCYAGDSIPSFKENNGFKCGLNYNIPAQQLKFDLGVYKYNYLFDGGGHDMGSMFNHNLFFATEFNLDSRFYVGPKIGYELNIIILQLKLNMIEYIDLEEENLLVFRPEIGLTVAGRLSLTYGYNIGITGTDFSLGTGHIVGLYYNFFLFK